jgi:NADH-quinone oxidoreductase subunit J
VNLLSTTLDAWAFGLMAQSPAADVAGRLAGSWNTAMIIPILLGAIGYSLLQCGLVQSKLMTVLGVICCAAGVVGSLWFIPSGVDNYIAFLFCAVATAGAIGFLTAREPVYAALGFATAVLSISGIMFMQSALFIAAANVIVYAGAIIIIFLFVLMFAQQSTLQTYDLKLTNPYLAAGLGAVMLGSLVYCLTRDGELPNGNGMDPSRSMSQAVAPKTESAGVAPVGVAIPGTTAGLGRSLYTDYLWTVALAGTILTVAAVGAIAIATKSTGEASDA